EFTLIGTTDRGFSGDPGTVHADNDEIAYLCDGANQHLRTAIKASDVVWAFAGVRALYDDGSRRSQDVTRDYVLELDESGGAAPLLTVYGGKITTYRRLAEHALDRLAPLIKSGPPWTERSHLPGGDFAPGELDALVGMTRKQRLFLADHHVRLLWRAYGPRAD